MKTDPAVKTALAFCVLLAGFCAAKLLRGDRPAAPASRPAGAEQLLIRARTQAMAATARRRRAEKKPVLPVRRTAPTNSAPIPVLDGEDQPATVVKPWKRRESPPPLAEEYPRPNRPKSAGWGPSMRSLVAGGATSRQTPRTHKIVDGDTLPTLADRYLGSASRAGEIFAANRDVLLDPELLPIGAELKIPPQGVRH